MPTASATSVSGANAPLRSVSAAAANPILAAIPANTALDLGAYTCQDPIGDTSEYCESITDYSTFTYDPNNHQLLMFGGGHAATFRDDVDVFNFSTLTWTPAYSSTPCTAMTLANMDDATATWKSSGHPFARHTYDMMVVTTNTKKLLLMAASGGSGYCSPAAQPPGSPDPFFFPPIISAYDPISKTWQNGLSRPSYDPLSAAEFDPISGRILVLSQYGLVVYDPVAHTWARHLDQFSSDLEMGYANSLVYFPPNDKFYYIAREDAGKVFELTLDRANFDNSALREVTGAAGAAQHTGETGWAYDSVNHVIGGGVVNGVFQAYDPLANAWTRRVMQAQSPTNHAIGSGAYNVMAFDPVDGVFVFISDNPSNWHMWAYRFGGAAPPTPTPAPTVTGTITGNRPRAYMPLLRR